MPAHHVDTQHSEARPLVPVVLDNKNLFIWLYSPLSAYQGLRVFKAVLHKLQIYCHGILVLETRNATLRG